MPVDESGFENGSTMRLQRFLARAGAVSSRRKAEQAIEAGLVMVNGTVVAEMGVKVDADSDVVELDGHRVVLARKATTILLNKPAGCYTTMNDQKGRFCVADLVPVGRYPGLYHIGRLDRDTTGALLLSTDGKLGDSLLHPSRHVEKEYLAQVEGVPSERELDRLRNGVVIVQGERRHACAPARVELVKRLPDRYRAQSMCLKPGLWGTSIVRVRIHEGVKHQVKLMLGAIGHKVVYLHRTQFGPIPLGTLELGKWRELGPEEVAALGRCANRE